MDCEPSELQPQRVFDGYLERRLSVEYAAHEHTYVVWYGECKLRTYRDFVRIKLVIPISGVEFSYTVLVNGIHFHGIYYCSAYSITNSEVERPPINSKDHVANGM